MDAFVAFCCRARGLDGAILNHGRVLGPFPKAAQRLRGVSVGKMLTGTPAGPDIGADWGTVSFMEARFTELAADRVFSVWACGYHEGAV